MAIVRRLSRCCSCCWCVVRGAFFLSSATRDPCSIYGIHLPYVISTIPIWNPFSTCGIHFPHVDSWTRRILRKFVLIPFSPEFPHMWISYSPSGNHIPHRESTYDIWKSLFRCGNHMLGMKRSNLRLSCHYFHGEYSHRHSHSSLIIPRSSH